MPYYIGDLEGNYPCSGLARAWNSRNEASELRECSGLTSASYYDLHCTSTSTVLSAATMTMKNDNDHNTTEHRNCANCINTRKPDINHKKDELQCR